MIGSNSGFDWALFGALCVAAAVFGALFNALVDWAHRRKYMDGFTWGFVVIGVAVTLALAVPLIGVANNVVRPGFVCL